MALLTDAEVHDAIATLSGWKGDARGISAEYTFATYDAGVGFAMQLALIAQRMDHHPDLTIGWCRVVVRYVSHDAGGVTARDIAGARAVAGVAPPPDKP